MSARWLPGSRLLITYVAGPYPDADQCRAIRGWLEAGGRWLALHGTSGGRAQRVEGVRQRRTVKMEHHALLGGYFLTHPPIREIRVEVRDRDSPLTQGLGTSFVVEDEPYFVELQDPAATRILLTADYGPGADLADCRHAVSDPTRRFCPTAARGCSDIRRRSDRAGSRISRSAIATTRRSTRPATAIPPTRRRRGFTDPGKPTLS